jgi:hypothetical protein
VSRDTALAEARKIKAAMTRHGVKCSIELQVGRPWSGDDWYSRKHVLMNHHTAGAKTGGTPSLALVKRGRSDLPGPLCNGYGGRDLVYRIITLGLANHPGAGGPLTVAGFAIPKDSARASAWGTEWEHDGVSAWPAAMREFMGRANAALCDYHGIPYTRSIEHNTWAPSRKIDRNGYKAATGQAEIKAWAGRKTTTTTPQEDDVTAKDIWAADLIPVTKTSTAKTNPTWGAANAVGRIFDNTQETGLAVRRLVAQSAARDTALLAAVKALSGGKGVDITAIQAAAKAGAEEALAEHLADADPA